MNGLDIYIYGYIWHSCSFYSNCRKWFQSIYCYYINSCPLQMENNTFGIEPHLIPIDGWLVIFTCKGCNLRQNVGLGWCNYFVLTTLRFGIFFSDFWGQQNGDFEGWDGMELASQRRKASKTATSNQAAGPLNIFNQSICFTKKD